MDPFIGQIQAFGFNFAPRGWATCTGELLAISSHSALYSLLGTTFGGDGRTTFGLPDLRGRSIIGIGSGGGLSSISWGERGGKENEILVAPNLPNHTHGLSSAQVNVSLNNLSVNVQTLNNGNRTNESGDGDNLLGTESQLPQIYREPGGTNTGRLGGVSATGTASGTVTGTTDSTGSNSPFNIRNPYLGMYVCIAMQGVYPSRS